MCRPAHCFRILLSAALLAALPALSLAQQSDLDPLAKKLAGKLKTGPTRVIVAGFLDTQGLRSPLGVQLAGEFAEALQRLSPGLQIVTKDEYARARKEELWTESDARDYTVVRSLALEMGARVLLTGSYERQKSSLRLTVVAFDFRKNKEAARSSSTIPLTPERARLDEQVFALRRREKLPDLSAAPAEYSGPVLKPGKDGVGFPECVRCPAPDITVEARAKKYFGRVFLRVVITPDGRTANIRVEKGAKYGMTEAAVKAVEKWRFRPARLNDKPVAVETAVEVEFPQPNRIF